MAVVMVQLREAVPEPYAVALEQVIEELRRAVSHHAPLNSPHEGYAVILEELDELWDEVKPNRGRTAAARCEAVQVAAMALRYIAELTDEAA